MKIQGRCFNALISGGGSGETGGKSIRCDSDQPPIFRFIALERWCSVRKFLAHELEVRESTDPTKSGVLEPADISRALRSACRRRPPSDVLRTLIQLRPSSASESDPITGRFGLHTAVEFGAPFESVVALAEAHPQAVGSQDGSGRTPLHELCHTYIKAKREHNRQPAGEKRRRGLHLLHHEEEHKEEDLPLNESMRGIVKCFRRLAPRGVNLEDISEMTALEYAIDNCVDEKTVRAIHMWSQRDWKNRAKPEYLRDDEDNWKMLWCETTECDTALWVPPTTIPVLSDTGKKKCPEEDCDELEMPLSEKEEYNTSRPVIQGRKVALWRRAPCA